MIYGVTLTLGSGLFTCVGGVIVLFLKRPTEKLIPISMGFAGGVMLTLSLGELLPFALSQKEKYNSAIICSILLCGIIVAFLVKILTENMMSNNQSEAIWKTAVVTALVITIHNLPEGVLTLFSACMTKEESFKIALGVALHNIPEGIAVALPAFCSNKGKFKVLSLTFFTALAEPFGGIIAYLFLQNNLTQRFASGMQIFICGIMCTVCAIQLLPEALLYEKKYGEISILLGIVIMCISIILF